MNASLYPETLYRQIVNCALWKDNLKSQLKKYQQWFSDHNFSSTEADFFLQRALELLGDEQLTLAVVGGLSRGKTELINALLYDHYGQKILSAPLGASFRCTMEIYYDPNESCSVRLLPIETRNTATSMESFKRIPRNWVTVNFDPKDPSQVRSAISRITQLKPVTPAEARQLGFDCDKLTRNREDNSKMEIPAWRHALINLEHPLLRYGLRIINAPGIDVLNNEPELTLNFLPSSVSVLFLLSADDGVSTEDMAIWKQHVKMLRDNQGTAVLTLINKIDTHHSYSAQEAYPDYEMRQLLHGTRETVARQLKLPMEHVLTLSAKEGLQAKVSKNQEDIERSNLLHLETILAQRLLDHQRRIAHHRVVTDVIAMMTHSRNSLRQRLFDSHAECEHLQTEPPHSALRSLRESVKRVYSQYHRRSLSLRSSQHVLGQQLQRLLTPVSAKGLERRIQTMKNLLAKDSSPPFLVQTVVSFFDELAKDLQQLSLAIRKANQILKSAYRRTDQITHNTARTVQEMDDEDLASHYLFNLSPYQQRLMQLKHQADQFHQSMNLLAASKNTLINRFVQSLVQEMRTLYHDIRQDIRHWISEAIALPAHCTHYDKQLLERHMILLTNLNSDKHTLQYQLGEIQSNNATQQAALASLDSICGQLETTSTLQLQISGSAIKLRTENRLVV